jgi:hypothetical protein
LSQFNCRVLQLEAEASTHQAEKEKNQVAIQLLMQRLEEAGLQEEQKVRGPGGSMQALKGSWAWEPGSENSAAHRSGQTLGGHLQQ